MVGLTRRAACVLAAAAVLAACGTHGAPAGALHAPATSAPARAESLQSSAATGTGALRVIGLGDSVMAGTNCGCSGLVDEYAAALGHRVHRPVHVDNLGDNGAVTDDLLTDLTSNPQTRSAAARADMVVVTIGANDLAPQLRARRSSGCPRTCFQVAAAAVGRNLSRVLRALQSARGGRTDHVLVTNYWNVFLDGQVALDAEGRAEHDWSVRVTDAANAAICRAARTSGARCVDLVRPFKGSGGRDPTPLLADDGDHPNAVGMKVIVAALMKATPGDL
ncbi:lysophospholipase L1-like esterase [Marmoricola sp. URHA0025 HA25]